MDSALSQKLKSLSFVLMIMVVYLHGYNLNSNLAKHDSTGFASDLNFYIQTFFTDGVFRVAVPLFFAISGFLQFQKFKDGFQFSTYFEVLKKRTVSIAIPYILVAFSSFLIFYVLQSLPFGKMFFNNPVSFYPFSEFLKAFYIQPKAYPLWFIRFLYEYIVFIPVSYFLLRYFHLGFLLMLFLTWYDFHFQGIFYTVRLSIETFFFFNLGAYLAMNSGKTNWKLDKTSIYGLCIFWLAVICTRFFYFDHPVYNYIFLIVAKSVAVLIVWFGYDYCEASWKFTRHLLKPAAFTFGIYLFHEPLLTILKKLLLKIIGSGEIEQLLVYFTAPTLAILGAYFGSKLFKYLFPGVYSVFTGGRG